MNLKLLMKAAGSTLVEIIRRQRPDLVFLDVQLPELDGLGVIEEIGAQCMPLTVFVTAYDQHAIRSFEAHALDYLLKPYSDERHEATMLRVKARLEERTIGEFGQRMLRMASSVAASCQFLDRVAIKSGGATRFLRVAEIDWIEAGRRVREPAFGREGSASSGIAQRVRREARSPPIHPNPSVGHRQH